MKSQAAKPEVVKVLTDNEKGILKRAVDQRSQLEANVAAAQNLLTVYQQSFNAMIELLGLDPATNYHIDWASGEVTVHGST